MPRNLSELEENLAYSFKNIAFLEQALRHRSSSGGTASNERLEFLGDATLSFVIAVELYQQYPDVEEGKLSRFRANLVNGETLAVLAQDFAVGKYLALGVGEKKSGGARRNSILADAMEAIIGAIYLDSDVETIRKRIIDWYKPHWQEILTAEQKDAKTRLQESLQARGYPLPVYQVKKVAGVSHSQIFHIECRVKDINEITCGAGTSKRRAEQDAAARFLELDVLKQLKIKD